MKRLLTIVTLAVMAFAFSAQAQDISLDLDQSLMTGVWTDGVDDYIGAGHSVYFPLRLINNSGSPVEGLTSGFRVYSPDGATWTPITWDSSGYFWGYNYIDPPGMWVVESPFVFDLAFSVNTFSITGEGADTIGFGGSKKYMPGLADGSDGIAYGIHTSVDGAQDGKTLCIDSSFYPPTGSWLWAPQGAPYWGGPYCWEISPPIIMPPVFTTAPTSYSGDHCVTAAIAFQATWLDGEGLEDCSGLTWSLEAGPGVISGSGCQASYSYNPSLADVGSSIVATIGVSDGINPVVTTDLTMTFTNAAPVFTSGCGQEVMVGSGNPGYADLTAEAVDCDPTITWSIVDVTPTPVGSYSIVDGLITFNTVSGLAPGGDCGVSYTFTVEITDGVDASTCTVDFSIMPFEPFRVGIEKVHLAHQGQHHLVDVTVDAGSEKVAGFDMLIAYDQSVLTFTAAIEGDVYTACDPGWEYFEYRFGDHGNCGNACPSGLLRVVGIAETNNGAIHPDFTCLGALAPGYTLFSLDFFLTDNMTYECMYSKVEFFWMDCGDNALAYHPSDNPLHVLTGLSRYVIGYDLIGHMENGTVGFPTFYGAQDFCFDGYGNPDKPAPTAFVDFYNGGIDIICIEDIDDRGDINMNGIVNEVADAVLFSNYFVYGMSVFTIAPAGQVAATDVNADGLTLSVADLVYLIRVIVGDALPYPKVAPLQATYTVDGGQLSVDQPMGAAFVVVKGNAAPQNLTDLDMVYSFDGTNTRILISSYEKGETFNGNFLNVNNDVVSVEFATYEGQPVADVMVPANFALHGNYPNPFNPTTDISFDLPKATDYSLVIYNVAGQKVADLSGAGQVGTNVVSFDASTQASGVYFYKLTADDVSATQKMVLLK